MASSAHISTRGKANQHKNTSNSNIPRFEELKDHHLEKIAQNYQLVCLIKNGISPRAAIKELGIDCSERRARDLFNQYNDKGFAGLIDKRWLRKTEPSVLTKPVKKIILAWWFARPAAGPKAIWEQVIKECKKQKLKEPGYDSVKKFIEGLPENLKLIREGKIRVWDKQNRPVVRYESTTYSNERWQLDHSRLKIWVRVKVNGEWVAREVHISTALDAQSRSIPSYILSTKYPDSWSVALLLRKGILPKENTEWKNQGLPAIVQPDRGPDFMSNDVIASLALLDIRHDPDPPHYPNNKGKVERWFDTLDVGCLRILPGHMKAIGRTQAAAQKHVHVLLTLPQLKKEVERWIVEDYHQRTHSETGRKPCELWEETVHLRLPESEQELNVFLLKSNKVRTVKRTGVDFGEESTGGRYWAPEITDYIGTQVRIRYNPEDEESILLYEVDTGKFICEAWLMGQENSKYGIEDVKRERSRYRRGMQERMKEYAHEIELNDRRRAEQSEWQEARQMAESLAREQTELEDDGAIEMDEEVETLIADFIKLDRGEK